MKSNQMHFYNCILERNHIMHSEVQINDVSSNDVSQADSSDAIENESTKNNPQVRQPSREKPAKPKNIIKTLRIGWLHRESADKRYRRMNKPFGGVRRLKLDESSFYSADRIREMAAERFADSLKDRYDVQLGLFDGQVISEFELPSGEPCDVWDYCRARNTTPYGLNLFILTSPRDDFLTDRRIDCAEEKLTRARRRTKIRNGEYVPRDDIYVLYHYVRVSKYSGEMSCTECRKRDLHTYFLEEQFGDGPAIEQFDPLDYGYGISRIEKDDQILMQIGIESDSSRSFHFPSTEAETGHHVVLHDVDELQGVCDGSFGLGFIPSCTCRGSKFTWYRDGQPFRCGESLYWLGNVVLEPGQESSTFWCVVACKITQTEIKSKEIQVTEEMIGKRLEYPY
ncbi:uncharacterized protein LOC116416020 isoform X2 [Nasonia vitripennis]|uniref:Uncharacterized protein n=1 Tax=Nasonia vitripennis TaxID=7425 RepID=A0A7M7Q0M9_NASVI|nr:uncharacterized protein LOC116416020 isoform X2 [Nasonia vitripennis]XP_031778121.1 uncharacterized protein LOC116416020 isoform X2 [Nasonia vitripennis]